MFTCRRTFRARTVLLSVAGSIVFLAVSSAQSQRPSNPPMASAQLENEKEALYTRFNDFKRNPNPEQQQYAYPTAKEYLRRWGGEKDAETKEIIKWVAEYERQMHKADLYAAYNAKKYAQTFEL